MMRIVPLRLMTWQNSHLRFTEALTFIIYLLLQSFLVVRNGSKTSKIQAEHYAPLPVRTWRTGGAGQTKLEYLADPLTFGRERWNLRYGENHTIQ
jgi:hypothetical protein